MSNLRKPAVWLIVIGVISFLIYLRGMAIPYFADDFRYFSESPCSNVLDHFVGKGPRMGFYRPIETAFLACAQEYFDTSTVSIRLTTISLHGFLSYLVFVVLLTTGYSHSQAVLGSLFMLFSQANASAVLGNDTLSQVSGTFWGCVSLWLLHTSFPNTESVRNAIHLPKYLGSVVAFAIALLSKESSVSFFPLISVVVLFHVFDSIRGGGPISLRSIFLGRGLFAFLPYMLVLLAYVITRSLVGVSQQPTFGAGGYNFRIGMNLIENVALLLLTMVIPASTVTAFVSTKSGQLGIASVMAVGSLLVVVLFGYGLWRSKQRGLILAMGGFSVCAMFPMVMMNHVSELYAYNSMPFMSMVAGVSLGTILERSNTRRRQQLALAMLFLLFGSHFVAVQEKASLMEANGRRATVLLNGLHTHIQRVPRNGELLLLNPDDNRPEYSVFLMRGFNVLRYGERRIKEITKRPDISVRILEEKNLERAQDSSHNALILSLENDVINVVDGKTRKIIPGSVDPRASRPR